MPTTASSTSKPPAERSRATPALPLWTTAAASNRATGGSGLGLSIAHWVARAHGGTLTVDDNARAGANFVLTIPLFVQ
ncbi:MAG: ATP-binding protein [Vulcanimicrobiaceae bacterium]